MLKHLMPSKTKSVEKYIELKGKKVEDADANDPLAPKVKAAESEKHQNFKERNKEKQWEITRKYEAS